MSTPPAIEGHEDGFLNFSYLSVISPEVARASIQSTRLPLSHSSSFHLPYAQLFLTLLHTDQADN